MIEEEKSRRDRLERLVQSGENPYPSFVSRTHTIAEFLSAFDTVDLHVTVTGRVKTLRKHGGLTFANMQDGTGSTQIAFKKDAIGEESYTTLHETLDVGDFLEATGTPFTTKKGEKTLMISSYRIIAKALLPLPEKWHGLSDVETRFRKRYLDLIMDETVTARFILRSQILSTIRRSLDEKGFLEVETPTLQSIYGGGFAKPFVTHHNSLGSDFYLRISDEMYLKRLIVGGFEKVYEITKVFRNEGVDRDHNPEFTMLEAQVAYKDYQWGMDWFEELIEEVCHKVLKSTRVKHEEVEIEFARPWKRIRLIDSLKEYANLDATTWTDLTMAQKNLAPLLKKTKQDDLEKCQSLGEVMALAFEELVEEKLIQPTMVYDYPMEVSPLAKKAKDPRFTERFEVFMMGMEVGNNYSELNDPNDLEQRFMLEKKKEESGFDEAHQTDEDYLEAVKHGMPPICGLGIGIDRMIMMLTGVSNIKEVILFPTLKPKE